MRKIVANFFISLDGVVEAPDQWHFPYFDEKMGQAVMSAVDESDAMLLGRKTYADWAEHWPKRPTDEADATFVNYINNVRKYVASTTLESAEWNNSVILKGDLAAELTELKSQPGKDIAISGSTNLVQWLLANDLLDELRLLVHPIVVGRGGRLFTPEITDKPLKLVFSETFPTGVVNLIYQPAAS